MTAITIRVSAHTAGRLDQLAEKLDRPADSVARQAIEDFIAREEWQLSEIEAGIAEADRGEFASDAEIADVLAKYLGRSR